MTIEHYMIKLKIEKAKELIEYDELNFTEIAYELGYKNLNHLSRQFKKIACLTMRNYKSSKTQLRDPQDKI